MEYPILELIKRKAEEFDGGKGKSIVALANELDISSKSIYNITSMDKVTVGMVVKLSKALEFDFLEDYNTWLINHQMAGILHVAEERVEYKLTPKAIKITSITLTLRGETSLERYYEKILTSVKKECELYGVEVDKEISLRGVI